MQSKYYEILKIAQIEQQIVTLQKVRQNKDTILSTASKKARNLPVEPIKPAVTITPIPHFDEKHYRKKAKETGSGLSGFRDSCIVLGCALASSVIGIVVCWIPFLLALGSLPFSVGYTRKKAYNLYIKECEEIESKNTMAQSKLKEYNKRLLEYNTELEQYKSNEKRVQQLILRYSLEFEKAYSTYANLVKVLIRLYDYVNIPSRFRNFLCIHRIVWYYETNKINSLSEILNLMQGEFERGEISCDIRKYRELLREKNAFIVDKFDRCELDGTEIVDILLKHIDNPLLDFNNDTVLRSFMDRCEENCNLIVYKER